MKPKYLTEWQHRFQRQKAEDKKRADLAKAHLPEAIEILKRHGAKRIILFGSLLQDDHAFRINSDIDLAVEGIEKQNFCRAYADLIMALDWPIDLKPIEELKTRFKKNIFQQGKIIYEI